MENSWEKRIEKHLLNQKIVKIKYMSEKESDRQGWSSRPIEITLSNGVLLSDAIKKEVFLLKYFHILELKPIITFLY